VSSQPNSLDRDSVIYAIKDYLLQVNYRGYKPDRRKVLSVRQTDRTAWLRNAVTPVRSEVYYYVEGELFPKENTTRLAPGQSLQDLAENLADQIWNELSAWRAYDFTPQSDGLKQGQYMDEPLAAEQRKP
jgi:hypothetical protein